MRTYLGSDALADELKNAVVAIGNFDGVHRGHQALLALARSEARKRGRAFGVLTFEPHPRTLFRPDEPLFRLSPPALKQRLLDGLGADFMLTLPFDRKLAGLEADDFVKFMLVGRLAPSTIVMGYDFHFGHGRKGNPETMRQAGQKLGFSVIVVEQVTEEGGLAPFSSSTIRNELRHGRAREAAEGLGYWWMLSGEVVKGDSRGKAIGFPTANIVLEPGVEPREGIYAVRVRHDGAPYEGAAYIGERPTFAGGRRFLEVYIFDFDRDIYGAGLDVEFLQFIRPDMKFATVSELAARMSGDCAEAGAVLRRFSADDPMQGFPLGRLQLEGRL